MDPLTMGLIGGGASLLGSIFSSSTNASNTQAQIAAQQAMQGQSEQFNAQQAQINRDYETQMSNTAYQRASADMKAAGLNPMIMAGGGGSASTPGGATASVGTPSVPMPQNTSPFAGIGEAVNKVFTTASQAQSLQKQQADIDLARSQKHNVDADTTYRDVVTANEGQRGGAIPSQVDKAASDAAIARNDAQRAANENSARTTAAGRLADQSTVFSRATAPIVDQAVNVLNSATGVGRLKQAGQALLDQRGRDAGTRLQQSFDDVGNLRSTTKSWLQQ